MQISTLGGGRIVYVSKRMLDTRSSLPLVLWKTEKNRFRHEFLRPESGDHIEKFFFFTPSTTETTLYAQGNEQVRLYADSKAATQSPCQVSPGRYMTDFSIITSQYACHPPRF